MDIGTPERYLQASWDILEGRVETELARRRRAVSSSDGAEIARRRRDGRRARASVARSGSRGRRGTR